MALLFHPTGGGTSMEDPSVASAAPSRLVALGGGTGLPILLRGLKSLFFSPGSTGSECRDRDRITAVVTVTDDGGSSGRLRQAYGILPPGDVRNCLLALSDVDPKITAIFNHRFNGKSEISNHNLGNLILAALWEMEKDFYRAVELGGEILSARGRVLPATLENVTLVGEMEDGTRVRGESRIAGVRRPISKIRLEPEFPRALPQVLEAIESADLIALGPGSLYTSLIPILLIPEVVEAISASRARVVLVMNLMTELGETEGYSAEDHVLAIRRHAPGITISDVLLNTAPISEELVRSYAVQEAVPVAFDPTQLEISGCRVLPRDLLGAGPVLRHDPDKLARAMLELLV